jgi:hypothetical protein
LNGATADSEMLKKGKHNTKSRMKGTVHQSALKEHPKYIGAFITSLLPYFEHTDTLVVPVLLSGTAQLSFLPFLYRLHPAFTFYLPIRIYSRYINSPFFIIGKN